MTAAERRTEKKRQFAARIAQLELELGLRAPGIEGDVEIEPGLFVHLPAYPTLSNIYAEFGLEGLEFYSNSRRQS